MKFPIDSNIENNVMEEIQSRRLLPIVERFITLSGEAPTIGQPMYLVRFSGCNLHCRYCDTQYHSEISEVLSAEQLCHEIEKVKNDYSGLIILFTGGEPLLPPRCEIVSDMARQLVGMKCYVETNGSILIDKNVPDNLYYVLDWKTPSAGGGDTFCEENLTRMRATHDVIKFVVDDSDLCWTLERIRRIHSKNENIRIYLSPQTGRIDLPKLAEFILQNRLNVSMSVQLHKIIWGEKRGV